MLQEERYELILQYLREHGSLSMKALVKRFGVSRETIRRDLKDMEEKGLLTKVHGGAVLNKVGAEPTFSNRASANQAEKKAIAKAALSLVEDGDTLFIDNGTTALQFAQALTAKQNVTVFTHSLPVATELAERSVRVYLTGGLLRQGELSLSGTVANRVADNFFVDKAFIGAGGISVDHGVTDFHVEESDLRRIILGKSAKSVVLADHSKFGVTAFARVATLDEIDYIVTDPGISEDYQRDLREHGVEVLISTY